LLIIFFFFFFFFQAEDGIRDKLVTGVQTCALPISSTISRLLEEPDIALLASLLSYAISGSSRSLEIVEETRLISSGFRKNASTRSEERRVGKECRSRWST